MKTVITGLALTVVAGCWSSAEESRKPTRIIDPVDDTQVEATLASDGTTYKLYKGGIYRVNKRSGKWEFTAQGYDLDYYKKNYVERNDVIFRKADDGKLYAVKRTFTDNFERAGTIHDLIGIKRGWTSMTLQSPRTPTIRDYVRLRKRILKAETDFVDNRVEPTTEIVHSGHGALKTYSVPRSTEMVTAKASLDTELLHFVKGDNVWFSGWYYVPEHSGMPTTLMDLETTWFKGHPGIRIMMYSDKYIGFELKWGAKPKYRQQRGKEVSFPVAKWVHLKYHLTLSEQQDGDVQLWQDGRKIIDTRGQTLPLKHTIYNSLEIGITAFSRGSLPATLYVDDVTISDHPN